MVGLDRLAWPAGISFQAYGLPLGLRINDPAALPRFVERLPLGWRPLKKARVEHIYSVVLAPAERESAKPTSFRRRLRTHHVLHANAVEIARTPSLDALLDVFESDVRLLVAEYARRRVFVHAGAVSWRGKAIIIPGLSYSGKTTLVAELLRAGATYYSDEFAVLDPEGRVHAYPKPLSIRQVGETKQTDVSADALGARTGRRPIPVGAVVVTEHAAGAKWRPKLLSPGEAALALLAHTVPARRYPDAVLDTLRMATSGAVGLKSKRGEGADAARAILASLDELRDARLRRPK